MNWPHVLWRRFHPLAACEHRYGVTPELGTPASDHAQAFISTISIQGRYGLRRLISAPKLKRTIIMYAMPELDYVSAFSDKY